MLLASQCFLATYQAQKAVLGTADNNCDHVNSTSMSAPAGNNTQNGSASKVVMP